MFLGQRFSFFGLDALGHARRQGEDFGGRQVPPGARRQPGQADRPDADAGQAGDGVADGGEHPAHLPVAALVDGQLDLSDAGPVYVLLAAQQADVFGRASQAVFQHDPFAETRQGVGIRNALHLDPVGLGDVVARVGQLEQEVAVVGQEDQALAVGVQAAHGPQHGIAADVNQFCHQPPGMRVGARRDDPAWLVQGEVVAPAGRAHDASVKLDSVRFRVYLRPQFGHDQAVDADAPLGDPLLTRPPGTDPGGGEHFLQSLGHKKSSLPLPP